MDDIYLKYGDSVLGFKRSEKIVAVKVRAGQDEAMMRDMPRGAAPPTDRINRLGDYMLLDIEQMTNDSERALEDLRSRAPVAAGMPIYYTSDDEVPFIPTGHIYIVFTDDAPLEDCRLLIEEHELQVVETRAEREIIAMVTPRSGSPVEIAAALQQSPLVAVAEPDMMTPAQTEEFNLPPDPLMAEQWHLRNTGFHNGTANGYRPGADARVIEAWRRAQTIGSPHVVLAIIDDGFDLGHPDLGGVGKIVAPRDFVTNSPNPLPGKHGTQCAGIAVGNANGVGIVGAAPGCRFMPVRWDFLPTDEQIERLFAYVTHQGAWVVSCSWKAAARNAPLTQRQFNAIARCAREGRNGLGCVICFATGNQGLPINNPAAGSVNGFAIHPEVIAVTASNSMDQETSYSNFGAEVSVCAPSSNTTAFEPSFIGLVTTDIRGAAGVGPSDYTNKFGGTSGACPLVAGISALLLSIRPSLTSLDVKRLIQSTANRIGNPASYNSIGHSQKLGFGRIDAERAVAALIG